MSEQTQVDRLGFVAQKKCNCEEQPKWFVDTVWMDQDGGWGRWFLPIEESSPDGTADEGYCLTCRKCRAELAVFNDADGNPVGYVRRFGFMRDVAIKMSLMAPVGSPENALLAFVDAVIAADKSDGKFDAALDARIKSMIARDELTADPEPDDIEQVKFECHNGHEFAIAEGHNFACPKCGLRYTQEYGNWVLENGCISVAALRGGSSIKHVMERAGRTLCGHEPRSFDAAAWETFGLVPPDGWRGVVTCKLCITILERRDKRLKEALADGA